MYILQILIIFINVNVLKGGIEKHLTLNHYRNVFFLLLFARAAESSASIYRRPSGPVQQAEGWTRCSDSRASWEGEQAHQDHPAWWESGGRRVVEDHSLSVGLRDQVRLKQTCFSLVYVTVSLKTDFCFCIVAHNIQYIYIFSNLFLWTDELVKHPPKSLLLIINSRWRMRLDQTRIISNGWKRQLMDIRKDTEFLNDFWQQWTASGHRYFFFLFICLFFNSLASETWADSNLYLLLSSPKRTTSLVES